MVFAAEVFKYAPELQGKITPPGESNVRLSYERFAELDIQAEAENWPPDWRMDHDAREANRHQVLAGRLQQPLWVFAYGSLIWDPATWPDQIRRARLDGWHRRFCMRLEGGRGTFDRPGLMLALDEGGACEGTVLRLPAHLVEQETEILWMREMFAGTYRPVFLPVDTPQGPIADALVFVMDRGNRRYIPELDADEAARRIAGAEGHLGRNFDYLASLVRHLRDLGIDDPAMTDLLERARALAPQD